MFNNLLSKKVDDSIFLLIETTTIKHNIMNLLHLLIKQAEIIFEGIKTQHRSKMSMYKNAMLILCYANNPQQSRLTIYKAHYELEHFP